MRSDRLLRLRLEPVEDRAHHPLRLGLLDVPHPALIEEDAVAREADVHVDAAELDLLHLHPALRAVHEVKVLEGLQLRRRLLLLRLEGDLALLLGVLANEVLVLAARRLPRGSPVAHLAISSAL